MSVTPGCKRATVDFPEALYAQLRDRAATPPAISVSEYIRRLVANHLNYDLPPWQERVRRKVRLDGRRKEKPGPKEVNGCE